MKHLQLQGPHSSPRRSHVRAARRPTLLAVAVAAASIHGACTASTPPAGADAGPLEPCPVVAPADGASCAAANLACVYEHCASEGVVRARCIAGDGGGASWSVTTTPCDSCGGRTCTAGTACMHRAGGALILDCAAHTCGSGPLDCACACGAGVECTIYGASDGGALYQCRVGCGAAICP